MSMAIKYKVDQEFQNKVFMICMDVVSEYCWCNLLNNPWLRLFLQWKVLAGFWQVKGGSNGPKKYQIDIWISDS